LCDDYFTHSYACQCWLHLWSNFLYYLKINIYLGQWEKILFKGWWWLFEFDGVLE
jgi:hypothetical protein